MLRVQLRSDSVFRVRVQFQEQSWEIVKKPLEICTRGSAKCIMLIRTSCGPYSLLLVHIRNGFLMISQLCLWNWTLTLKTETEENSARIVLVFIYQSEFNQENIWWVRSHHWSWVQLITSSSFDLGVWDGSLCWPMINKISPDLGLEC